MRAPVIVLGGGPAGAAAAITLARAGVPCHLLERSVLAEDKVCGEFLSAEAVSFLDGLGFSWAAADAVPIRFVRLEHRDQAHGFALPFHACTIARPALDAWLLQRARQSGATVECGVHVRSVARNERRFVLDLGADTRETSTLVLATGKHGVGTFHPRRSKGQGLLIGWKMNFHRIGPHLQKDFHDTLALFFFRGGYGGVVRTGKDVLTVSLLIQSTVFRSHGAVRLGFLRALADECPLLKVVLESTEPLWPQPKTISNLPYGHCDALAEHGLFPVGDQFAVLPSFTGTGIAFALASGRLAAMHVERLLKGESSAEQHYTDEARDSAAVVLRHAMPLHHLLQRPLFAALTMVAARWVPPLLPFLARRTRAVFPNREYHAP